MNVDYLPGSQDPSNSHWHAMSNGLINEDPKVAESKTNKYIDENLRACTLQGLARAFHAEQDKYSEAHSGYQPWYGGTPSLGHLWDDSGGALGAPLRAATAASITLFKRFKSLCPCMCKEQ